MATTYSSTIWVDKNGWTRQTILQGNASLATVVAKLLLHSVGGQNIGWESGNVLTPSSPSTGPFGTITDWAQLVFQTSSGSLVRVTLPAPNSNIFLADGETVDPSTIVDIIAAVTGTVVDNGGNAVVSYISGVRAKSGNKEYLGL